MSGTIIGIANAFGASISPGAAQGSAPGPPPSQDPMNFYVTPYNSAGTSTPSGQYKLGLYSTGIYNFTVDWGDGNTDVITSYNQPEVTHDYGTVLPTDIFEITITPNSPIRQQAVNSWYFGNRNEGDGVKVRSIDQFGATLFYADQDIFYGCEVLGTFASTISNVPTILNKVIGDGFFFNCDELAPAFYTAYWVGPFTGTAESFNEGKSVAGLPVGNSRGKFELDFTPTNMFRAFKNQAIFNQNDVGLYWDVSSCNNFTECFSSCLRYNQPFPNWTFLTGTPVFAADMFKNAVDFNQNITGWNTSAFQDMGGMFARTLPVGSGGVTDSVFNQAIGVWNTDNVRDASAMFFNAVNFNQDLSNWFSTGSLQNIGPSSGGIVSMFSGATSFNSSVANWDLTNPLLTSVSYVFNGATSFDQPLNSWDVSGVSFFVGTFNGATAFNQNLALWDVSSGLFFSEMFKGATSFVGTSLTSWNVSSATDMQDMFNGATSFTNSLVFWNPSSVTNMSGMFNGATLANPNVSGWNISSLANASDMFTNSGLSSFNYQGLLVAWAAQAPNIQNGVTLSSINQYANFGAPADAKAKLVNDYGWTITDLVNPNLPPPALTFTIDTTATEVGSTANNQYRLPLISSGTYDFYVQWGDGDAEQITSWNQAEATHTYAAAGTYTVKMFAVAATTTPIIDHISWASQDGTTLSAANDRLKVQDISEWAAAVLYLNEYVFTNCENLNITTTSSPTFGSKVLRTSAFENCDNLSGDLSGWGTVASPITGLAGNFYKNSTSNPNFNFVLQHNVGSLIQPFQNCAAFNNPLNNWDVSSVIGFTAAFSGASAFNQDISGWDTGNSSAFNAMFSNALAFNQNISSWNVASVTTFSQMFQGATLFNQPVGAWTTTSLTNLFSTFKNAAAFDQDLANWDVSGVTTAVDMLTGSNISAANWDALLIGWAAQGTGAGSLQANVTLSNINQLHGSVDSAATAAYNKLTSAPYNWTIVDLGGAPVGNLLLDTSYGSGAEAAYSVRKLRTAYTGPAMKVQDTVGGATQDIYFDANDNLDEAAIISYGGSNDVFVETWYDQSVNGNNATQVTSANRPKIYDGTTGAIVKDNGKVALDFDGANDYLSNAGNLTYTSGLSIYAVSKFDSLSNTERLICDDITGVQGFFIYSSSGYLQINDNDTGFVSRNLLGADLTQQVRSFNLNGSTGAYNYAYNGSNTSASIAGWTGPINSTNTANIGVMGSGNGSQLGDGLVQEIIAYPSDKSTDRTSIESNVGDYFTQNTPLLDTYSGAAAAYSLRLLDSTYTGFAIKVQDNVGGATQDIGFNVFGELDTVSLAAYAGSNDVFVETWYDQSGNGNNATQISSTARPKIYDGATGVVLENGKPAVEFDGSSNYIPLVSGALPSNINNASGFAVYTRDATSGSSHTVYSLGVPNTRWYGSYLYNSDNKEYFSYGTSFPGNEIQQADTNQHIVTNIAGSTQGDARAFLDGTLAVTASLQSATPTAGAIGSSNSTGSNPMDGTIQEFIVYHSDESANRTGIESNINTFYDVYTAPVAPLLLNEYPGAAAAYSLRKINSSYQGSAVLVQTALNTKGPVYIGFDSNNDLDTTSLAAYGGSEDVVVAGWLDQSGNGNDATQGTSANRPKIYDGTTGVATDGNKPCLELNPSQQVGTSLTLNNDPIFVACVGSASIDKKGLVGLGGADAYRRFSIEAWPGFNRGFAQWIGDGSTYAQAVQSGVNANQSVIISHKLSDDTKMYRNGSLIHTLTDNLDSSGVLGFGYREAAGTGKISEAVIYTSDQSTNRTDIEENIGGYYDIPLPGLLDENPGAAAAYSLRRLSSTYTGSAIQVQRADNVGGTTDIGFDSYGDLDTAALATAAQGNDMAVATWYDQSGNSNNATQATSANRPKIYDGTTGVVTENGKPAVEFDGSIDLLQNSSLGTNQVSEATIYSVFHKISGEGGVVNWTGSNSNANTIRYTTSLAGYRFGWSSSSVGTDTGAQLLFMGQQDGANGIMNIDGTSQGTFTVDTNRYWDNILYVGKPPWLSSPQMKMSEFVMYWSVDSASKILDIEENIGGYYDIPLAGLLDENPGAAAGYSLRRLSSTYTGSAIQVQRADNVGGTTDIGFDSYGDLDTTALATAAQGNDMVVATWYDQSGNGNDASQATSASRPKIYDATTGVVTENGKPAVQFDGINDGLLTSSTTLMYESDFTALFLASTNNITSTQVFISGGSSGSKEGRIFFHLNDRLTHGFLGASTGSNLQTITANTQNLYYTENTGFHTGETYETKVYIDGGNLATATGTGLTSPTGTSAFAIGINGHLNSGTLDGKIQETIIYPSVITANRLSIEDNVGEYYGIEIAGLLDQYSGAAAGYSLRKLSNSYTGFAIKVQDNVGGATQDIGFNADGELDTVALLAYAGSNDVFVETWYDQSGNGNNATQVTSANRPKIVSSGAVIVENGKPAVDFDGSNDFFTYGIDLEPTTYPNYSNYLVCTPSGQDEVALNLTDTTEIAAITYGRTAGTFSATTYNGVSVIAKSGAHTIDTQALVESYHNFNAHTTNLYLNNNQQSGTEAGRGGTTDSYIGQQSANIRFWSGKIQEVITYQSDESSNRTGIENNINFFYDIY